MGATLYTKQLMDKCGVAWFKMDETDSGSLIDSKGNNVGTVTGTTVVDGYKGKAREFNGTSDYITFSSSIIPKGAKSIRLKIKVPSIPSASNVVLSNGGFASGVYGTTVYVRNNGLLQIQITEETTVIAYANTVTSICDNQWHDVLFTTDNSVIKCYLDDMVTPVFTGQHTKSETTNPSKNLFIGRYYSGTGAFVGALDEVEIYNDVIDKPLANKILFLSDDGKVKGVKNGYETKNLVPTMTANNTPSPYVISASTYNTNWEAWRAFNSAIANGWQSTAVSGWIQVDFSVGTVVNKYSITASNNDPTKRSPRDWTLKASNDGSNFTVLDTRKGQIDWSTDEKRVFELKNEVPYRYYRLDITSNVDGVTAFVNLAEIEFFQIVEGSIWHLENVSEQNFLAYGADVSEGVSLGGLMSKETSIIGTTLTLGEGKTFEHTINLGKRPVKKITL